MTARFVDVESTRLLLLPEEYYKFVHVHEQLVYVVVQFLTFA